MIEGLNDLRKIQVGLSVFTKEVRATAMATARNEMDELRDDMIARTPQDTGMAKSRWSALVQGGDTLQFWLGVPYGLALDTGSAPRQKPWPSPGPRTELYKGRIFSSQVADGEGGITAEVLTEIRKGDIAATILESIYKDLVDAVGR